MANQAREVLDLDEVVMMVAGDPWQKTGARAVTSAEIRFDMVQAAVGDRSWLRASRLEIDREGPTYTIDTVEVLRAQGCEVTVIVGTDAANGLSTWHRIFELVALCSFAVVGRPGLALGPMPRGSDYSVVDTMPIDAASATLRSAVAAGHSIEFLVPDPVIQIIQRESLYGWVSHD